MIVIITPITSSNSLLESIIEYLKMKDIKTEIDIAKSKIKETTDHTSVVISCGPYTTSDGLSFSPFGKFINFLKLNY